MRCDVLIVGAGPTGPVLALWLAKLGVRVRIIDRTAGPGTTSRALAGQARTLELYEQLGLADAVVSHGHKVPAINLWVKGQPVAQSRFDAVGADLTRYAQLEIFPQDQHEQLLVERLKALGIEVERRTELLSCGSHQEPKRRFDLSGEVTDSSPDSPMAQGGSRSGKVRNEARVNPAARQDRAISRAEAQDIEDRSSPRTPVIYATVRKLGEDEMARPAVSLWWSGFAAGLSISFSLLTQAILQQHLPDAPWRPLVANFGYCVGFIVAVLSRQQLFTENTITVVLPVLAKFNFDGLLSLCRLWSIVLAANLAGTLFAAMFCLATPVLSPELLQEMVALSGNILGHGWLEMVFKAIAAGFLMAALVWMLPGAESAQFFVITMMTWLISAGGFMHIVAGSVEAFLLVLNGNVGWGAMLLHFWIPVLVGNVIGGTALFALIAYAQVMKEI